MLVLADRVQTLKSGASPADALLLRDGRVLACGRADELLPASSSGAGVLDLRGCTITPGLTDAHIHLLEWALSRRELELGECRTPEEVAERVARALNGGAGDTGTRRHGEPGVPGAAGFAASPPPRVGGGGGEAVAASAWLRGRGWNPHHWGGAYPHRSHLDAVAPDRPVVLQSHDMHALWVNTRALEQVGISADTPDPEGGVILRDADGQPTGVLLEMAAQLLATRLAPPTIAQAEAALLDAQAALHRLGITGVHSFPGIHIREPDTFWLLQRLQEGDLLRLRVLQHIPADRLDDAIRLGLRSGFGGEWIRTGAVKLFLDGALGSRTALLRQPYEGEPGNRGLDAMSAEALREVVARAARAGLAAAVHAIGDAAVERALDVLADPALRVPAMPHRIEHLQLCPPARLADAARAGIVASMQPAHLISDWWPALAHWGKERCRGAYAFRSLLLGTADTATRGHGDTADAGEAPGWPNSPCRRVAPSAGMRPGAAAAEALARAGVLAFGSDAPVEPVDPRLAFWAATLRQDLAGEPAGGWFPAERLAMEDVLRAFTLGPALASGAARDSVPLAPGTRADFVAWDRDPLSATGAELLELRCVAAVVGGELVWRH
jgi:predicted amidohydrolase YtcJ